MAQMDKPSSRNVALLIDADNASFRSIDPVLTVLAELGTVNIRRVYGNWSKPGLTSWAKMTLRHAIEPYQQFDLTKGKNATDMKMTIDAMDLLFSGRVDGFGIMSSDSDFTPLVMRIKQQGVPVYGFGTAKTPEPFRQACTRFIDVAAIAPAEPGEPAADVAEKPAAPPKPRRTRKSAGAAAATASAEPEEDADIPLPADMLVPISPRVRPLDAELLKLLVDAYNASKRDDRGWASLSAMGQLAGNRSSFDVRNYGYSRLADLMKAIPNFQTEQREGNTFVKRLR
ncbi:NYN domain-containing protein [Sphingomonas jatrophae]|uniref:TIGR00288 family protein n=1 Tax=Sphingomonas jatrophae TaxID=1166337 RepID=A0A1I6JMU1_9SPHN|nr:NYN domain-containing protein [Sphingomonas jatrophae]SFR80293.1 TIGR00288 family protein [Sphingomonas jatrophae]